jgi:hypothetical protein
MQNAPVGPGRFLFGCSLLSFRDGPKDQTRNLEIPGLVLAHHPGMTMILSTIASTLLEAGLRLSPMHRRRYRPILPANPKKLQGVLP